MRNRLGDAIVLAFCLLLFRAPGARAQAPGPPSPVPVESAETARAAPTDWSEKAEGHTRDTVADSLETGPQAADEGTDVVEIHGRVFAAAAYEDGRVETRDLATNNLVLLDRTVLTRSVPSARASLRALIVKNVALVLEADFAGRPKLKDGFVQVRTKRWLIRAGQLKMPISAFNLESPWRLPLARRGLLHDLLSDQMGLSGRRLGGMAQVKGGGYWDPAITAGLFQPVRWGADAGDPLETTRPGDAVLVGRFSVTPGGVELAAVGQRRVTLTSGGIRAYWAAGLDVTGDLDFERSGLRYWAEALYGSSYLDYDPTTNQTVRFWQARALVGYRWGGLRKGRLYLEPFVTAGSLDPDVSNVADNFLELMGGVNLGHWRQTRITLQLEWDHARRNFPRQFFEGWPDVRVRHTAAVLQLGAAF
jgi:hypothetical protein